MSQIRSCNLPSKCSYVSSTRARFSHASGFGLQTKFCLEISLMNPRGRWPPESVPANPSCTHQI
ncbi:hypothetical protein K470DRAFT_97620 [Piedraia hortae CBS 480.64]|uniref:Uncharacterized protein n=1 Tax=Piedraia hortae CBS 480.64 TaxID=1314780 RepID=A0A6A7BWH8_9PEZI|nr:hypothetical protein K470DRAFT_97620 [Piedraia hortae CBS 480.64]